MDDKAATRDQGFAWRSALSLGLVALVGTALLAGVNQLTHERIKQQERRAVLVQLGQIIATDRYNNPLQDDRYTFRDPGAFPSGQSVTVYRARWDGEPVAAIFRLSARDGYNGDIQLLIGIDFDGRVAGVRVVSHKETPGLGDAIETVKDDWILDFDGRSLGQPLPSGWAVKKDGGEFDQFTGATITPRAVVKAVRMTLEYFNKHRSDVFAQASQLQEPEDS